MRACCRLRALGAKRFVAGALARGAAKIMCKPPSPPKTSRAGVAPLSLIALEARYPELHRVYTELSDREKAGRENFGDPGPVSGLATEIMGVDFTSPLAALPDSFPFKTGSDTNRFAMFLWKMLDACESGSVGGDACRMSSVLVAAANDSLSIFEVDASSLTVRGVGPRFEHLLGLTLAIVNHGVASWLERGDPDNGKRIFLEIGKEWRKILALPEERLAAEGISAAHREFASKSNDSLQRYLKASREHHGPYANTFTFNFIAKPRAKPSDAAKDGNAKKIDGRTKEGRALKELARDLAASEASGGRSASASSSGKRRKTAA